MNAEKLHRWFRKDTELPYFIRHSWLHRQKSA
jgi:hypothetical protein